MRKPNTGHYFVVTAGNDEHLAFADSSNTALALVAKDFLDAREAKPADMERILGAGKQIVREADKPKRGPKPKVQSEVQA